MKRLDLEQRSGDVSELAGWASARPACNRVLFTRTLGKLCVAVKIPQGGSRKRRQNIRPRYLLQLSDEVADVRSLLSWVGGTPIDGKFIEQLSPRARPLPLNT